MYRNYLHFVRDILSVTYEEKSTNTVRVLFALNSFQQGATYTNLLRYSLAFNQSSLTRTLQNCLSKNYITYDSYTKLYKTNFFFDINLINNERLTWINKILGATLIGANRTLIRLSIYLIAVNTVSLSTLANEIHSTEENTEKAILAITDELGTEIILYDENTKMVEANLNWFK